MNGAGKSERFPLIALEDHLNPGGVNDAYWAMTESYSKANSDVSPYLIPNEWIAGRLAQFLCLPIVPFALHKKYRRPDVFASLGMTRKRIPPPPGIPSVCLERFPDICAGTLVFDILIANCDRHARNVRVDKQANPKWMRLIDHDRALFGYLHKGGIERLNEVWSRLGISGGKASGGNRHIYLDAIHSAEAISKWCDRVYKIPDWYIEEICNYVVGMGILKRECKCVIEFLQHRRRNIATLVSENRQEFLSIDNWGWLL